MPTIVEHDSSNAELFLSVAGTTARVVESLDELRRSLAEDPEEYAVVLGPTLGLEAASALADGLRITRPAVSVILIRRRVDTSVLAEALRSGMREVVEERDLTGLGEALKRAHQVYVAVTGPRADAEEASSGRLVTVFSPKGGVGKTTIAVNLAVALAASGDRRVCLVDLDLSFGDVAITLQLTPARTLADAVALEDNLDYAGLEATLTPHRRGFSTLVAPLQPHLKETIPPTLICRVLSLLKANFDYVVVDSSPGFDEPVLQALDATDDLLIVSTLDVPTLKNVKVASETLDLLGFPLARRHLVLNRADDRVGLAADKIEATLDMKILQAIPTSLEVANATNAGDPITASHPKHAVSQAIRKLASSTAVAGAGAQAGLKATNVRRGLRRRQGRSA